MKKKDIVNTGFNAYWKNQLKHNSVWLQLDYKTMAVYMSDNYHVLVLAAPDYDMVRPAGFPDYHNMGNESKCYRLSPTDFNTCDYDLISLVKEKRDSNTEIAIETPYNIHKSEKNYCLFATPAGTMYINRCFLDIYNISPLWAAWYCDKEEIRQGIYCSRANYTSLGIFELFILPAVQVTDHPEIDNMITETFLNGGKNNG